MNQFDKTKIPYIYHPIHLTEQMDIETDNTRLDKIRKKDIERQIKYKKTLGFLKD